MREFMSKQYQLSAQAYHDDPDASVYRGNVTEHVVKRSADMVQVSYSPCHSNETQQGARAGRGNVLSKWVFSEDSDKAEGISETGFNLFIDFFVEPNAALGLHDHHDKEEIYYLLEGELTVGIVDQHGQEKVATLQPGDAHFIKYGQAHWAQAGAKGARVIAVAIER